MKGAGPLPNPPCHSKAWGRGATASASEGGSEGRSLAPSRVAQQGLELRNTGLPKVRAVTAGLCYPGGWRGSQLGKSYIPSHGGSG